MSTLLKDKYSVAFYEGFLNSLEQVGFGLDKKRFFELLMDARWEDKSLKERMYHTTFVWRKIFNGTIENQSEAIVVLTNYLKTIHTTEYSLEYLFLADFISTYLLEQPELAIKTIETVTTFTSCEFAIRPFLIHYPVQFEKQMLGWSTHTNEHLRRLASEGIRPRLPWGEVLRAYVKDPSVIFPILDNLTNDPSEYVRRSVSNNINDISKTHPALVLDWCNAKKSSKKDVQQLIKHGLRTLLKQGDSKALGIIGIKPDTSIQVKSFEIQNNKIPFDGELQFTTEIQNTGTTEKSVRVEYKLYFKRLNKEFGEKVFQITSQNMSANSSLQLARKYSFKPITTRSYYPGEHFISLIVNGEEQERVGFVLGDMC